MKILFMINLFFKGDTNSMDNALQERLMQYLNSTNNDDTYHKIIIIVLNIKEKVSKMSITEFSDMCFVSPSTITRLCKYFGCESFPIFKSECRSIGKNSKFSLFRLNKDDFQTLKNSPQKFMENYTDIISSTVRNISNDIDYEQIDNLLTEIHENDDVHFYGYSTSETMIDILQMGFLNSGKLVYNEKTEIKQLQSARELSENSLAIVVSCFWNYMSIYPDIIKEILNSKARLILLTQNNNFTDCGMYDQVISISKNTNKETGTYALLLGVEYIVRRYSVLYS